MGYVQRRLLCDAPDCGFEWSALCETGSENPDCPVCTAVAKRIPGGFSIKTDKSRAVDFAQSVAEREWGLTDIADNQREGDVAYKADTPQTTAQEDAVIRQMVEATNVRNMEVEAATRRLNMKRPADFWSNSGTMTPTPSNVGMGGGPVADFDPSPGSAALARAEGADPIGRLHEAGKRGHLGPNGMPMVVVASDRPTRRRKA